MALKIQSTIVPEGDFPAVEAKDVLMPDGKRLPEALGGIVSIIGTTENITPAQIETGLSEGKTFCIEHTDSIYGAIYFSSFTKSENYEFVSASTIFKMAGGFLTATLMGSLTNGTWTFSLKEILTKDSFLSGTTAEITPAQVSAAVMAGDPVAVSYTDSTYGLCVFSDFAVGISLKFIASSFATVYNGKLLNASLAGDIEGGTWSFTLKEIATADDIVAELPEVTAEDNGKFLGVVNGAWAAVTVSNAEDTSF